MKHNIVYQSILFIIIGTSCSFAADVSIVVDNVIHADNNGKYIIVSLQNKTQGKISTSYFKDKYYGDILVGDLFSMSRYGNNEIMTMKLCATYIMPELILESGNKYEYKIYEKETASWSFKYDGAGKLTRSNIEFIKGKSIIVTYPRFGGDTAGDICSSEIKLE